MAGIGFQRQIEFSIADANSVPVTGCTLASFAIGFTRNGQACADTLVLQNQGSGKYWLVYTPSTTGRDVITIDDNTNDLHYCDIEIITLGSDSSAVQVTQDYGGSGALRPSVPDLEAFTLYAFLASDWEQGNTDRSYARGAYQLDSTGNWSLMLLPGTYDLVLTSPSTTTVFKFQLVIE